MEVTYTLIFQDRLDGYRTGSAYMTMPARFAWAMLALWFLTLPTIDPILHHHLIIWLLTTQPSSKVLVKIALLVSAYLSGCFISGLAIYQLNKTRTVKLQERHLLNKTLWWNRIRWRNVTNIVETAEHICFCHNIPTAVIVPKSAFSSRAEAEAFLNLARHFWCQAKGIPPPSDPDVSGVWPPAPDPSRAGEPGGRT